MFFAGFSRVLLCFAYVLLCFYRMPLALLFHMAFSGAVFFPSRAELADGEVWVFE